MPTQEELQFDSLSSLPSASTFETKVPESTETVSESDGPSSLPAKRKFNWSFGIIFVLVVLLVASLVSQSHILQSANPGAGSGAKTISDGKPTSEMKTDVGAKPIFEVKPKSDITPNPTIAPNHTERSFAETVRQVAPQIIKQERRSALMAPDTVIEPGHWVVKTFVIKPEMYPASIVGSFRASGGTGNDIRVFIADDEGFINTQNNHEALYYYHSGKVTVGSFNLLLKPGRYHLVFDNTFSIMANKIVRSDITLIYQE